MRSTSTVIRFGWELQMTGSGHRIGQRRSKASLPSLGTLSAASLCSARCLPWRRVCANSTRPNLAGPLRQGPSVAAWGLSFPNASFSLGLARLTLQRIRGSEVALDGEQRGETLHLVCEVRRMSSCIRPIPTAMPSYCPTMASGMTCW